MTLKNKSQAGFGHAVVLLVGVLVVAVIAVVGVRVINQQKDKNTDVSSSAPAATKTSAPQTVQNKEDLDTTKASLNQSNVDGDLNSDDLNGDIDSLL